MIQPTVSRIPATLTARRRALLIAVGLGAGALVGCAPPAAVRARAPTDASSGLARCKVVASQDRPLVTEWPASEKANLEARLADGPVVVAYSGCSLRVLAECKAPKGSYAWQRTTLAHDTVEIRSADDLYAKLPLGAASLEGELQASGRLAVQTTVVGQLKLEGLPTADVPTTGPCEGATHVIGAVTLGAFKLKSGGKLAASGGAGVLGIGSTGGSTSSEETLVREAGDPKRCADATDAKADPACRTPLQLFLSRLPKLGGATEPAGAEGMVKVTLDSDRGDRVYSVLENGKAVCKTPCTRWVRPDSHLVLAGGSLSTPEAVPDLAGYVGGAGVRAVPRGVEINRRLAGMVLSGIGGGGTFIAAVVFPMFGVEAANNGKSTTGYVVGGVAAVAGGLGMLGPGIALLVTSGQGVDLSPTGATARLRFAPGYLAGTLGRDQPVRFLLAPGGAVGTF